MTLNANAWKAVGGALVAGLLTPGAHGAGRVEDCLETSARCDVEVRISQVTAPGGDRYCLAQLPEILNVKGTTNGGPEKNKRIVWSLRLDPGIDTAKFKFRFQGKQGILLVVNPGTQPQLHSGRIGDGGGAPNDDMKYNVQNRRNKKPNTAIYLPLVLQTEVKPGVEVETLCGAADPRIVND